MTIVQVDGWERGAVILGACDEDGVLDAMRVRFADGVEDAWPIADFRWRAPAYPTSPTRPTQLTHSNN